jgi:hypothetical protein
MDSIFGNYDAALNAFENPTEREIDGDWDEVGADTSEYDGEPEPDSEDDDEGYQMTDVEADADTLASAGWGTDEDYGDFGDNGFYDE